MRHSLWLIERKPQLNDCAKGDAHEKTNTELKGDGLIYSAIKRCPARYSLELRN